MTLYTQAGLPMVERHPMPTRLLPFVTPEAAAPLDAAPTAVPDVPQAEVALDRHPSQSTKVLISAASLFLRPEWQEEALCSQTDPEAFFPEKGGSTREAKRICGRCVVRFECLEYALKHEERFGVWGGMSEQERRRLRRRVA